MKLKLTENQLDKINEEMGIFHTSATPLGQRWHNERAALKKYLVNYGRTMISKENGKEYKTILDTFVSNLLGINYCICVQWDSMTNIPGEIIYVRAYDKFAPKP